MKKISILTTGILFSLIGIASAESNYCGTMGSWGYGMMSNGFFGWIIQLMIIIFLGLAIYWLIKKINKKK